VSHASQPSDSGLQPIKQIEITGLYSISEDELLYLLDISKGKMLDKSALKEGIKRAFLKGIFDDIIVESIDRENTLIKVTVKEKKVIRTIRVKGNDYFSKRFIRNQFTITKGERLNALRIKNGIKHLEDMLRKKGFAEAAVTYTLIQVKGNRVDIEIEVKEGEPQIIKKILIYESDDIVKSHLRLSEGGVFDRTEMERLIQKVMQYYKKQEYIQTAITYSYENETLSIKLEKGKKLDVSFENNFAINSDTLMKEVPFYEVNEFSYDLVEETTAKIVLLYHKYGYALAQVAPIISMSEEGISLKFFIFEGNRYKVDAIKFEGTTIPPERLKDILTLKKDGYYNPELLEVDRDVLTEFYHALGYLYMEIKEPEVNMTGDRVAIKFILEEGIQVKISAISVKDNTRISTDEILHDIPLKKGNPYNELDISDSKRKIQELYLKRGYLDVKVAVERELSDSSANISFVVHEGDTTLFGKSIIIGNEQTKEKVIKREFLHKEDTPLDYGLLIKEKHRLYKLGLFTDVEVTPSEKADNKKDILYKVKEGDPGALEFGFGYGEYERLRGFFDISYKNLWGINDQVSFRTEMSTLEKRFMVSYNEPWFMNKEVTFKSLLLHEDRKEKSIDTKEIRYRLRRDSATAGIEKKITETLKGELNYDFSLVKTIDVKPDIILTKEDTGTLVISGIRPGFIYDTRDNPFEPRSGVIAGASFKFASAAFLSETDFAKLILYANKYQSLSKRLVLAVSLRGGVAQGLDKTRELPLVERFFLGGRTTVRGYEQDTLGPKGVNGTPTGGNAFVMGNLELRTDVGKGFGIVTFLDGGNVFKKANNLDITNLKYTAGVGLRYNTPVGPFRIDYGHKLNRERGESRGEIHFSLGHAF
jgi:outer membrane protein insertion porin family